jgi:hypothetical protein
VPAFAPRLDILPPAQRALWDELGAVPAGFTLYRGTAVALHLGHRESIDFDFFCDTPLDPSWPPPALSLLAEAIVTQREPDTYSCIVNRDGPVRLSFFGVPRLPRLRPALRAPGNGLPVADLMDLAGTKAAVVQRRAEDKDYLDIDAMLTDGRIDLPTALSAAQALYGHGFNPLATLKALTYFQDGTVTRLATAVRQRLVAACRAVDLDALPLVQARR